MGDTSDKLMHAVSKVREGKLDSVRELISSSRLHYSEAWPVEGYVFLLEAVKCKQNDIAKLLLECGCKVNNIISTENSNTPLHFAVLNNDIEMVQILLSRGANINAKAEKNIIEYDIDKGAGYTPLHLAVHPSREEIIKLLLNRGANVNAETQSGITAIYIAFDKGHRKLVDVLLKYGAKVDFIFNNTSLLHEFVRKGYSEIVEVLLKLGADINRKDARGRTALHIAIQEGSEEIVEVLLKCGAKIDFTNTPPLHMAVKYYRTKIIGVLLKFGADINSIDEYGRTALHIAAGRAYTGLVEALLKFGADIDSKAKDGRTALHIAIQRGSKKFVEVLLKCGDKINFINTPPLHVAVRKRHIEITEVLIKFGADIDSTDKDGRTALHIAIQEGNKKLVEVLLKCGAKIDFMNTPPLHVAVRNNRAEIIEVLLKFGVDIDSKDENGRTALHIAAASAYENIIEDILKFGADSDSKDEDGRTALHYACKRRCGNGVLILLKHGCDINVTCKKNQSPLDLVYSYDGNSRDILKRHIIKMKAANLYVSRKNLLSINSKDEIKYKDLQNKCEKEIASMKSEKVNNANISFYDILTKGVNQLAVYVKNDSIAHVLRSNHYIRKFSIYASMIKINFRKGEERRELLEQYIHINKIFYLFHINFGLPQECTEEIFSYLSNKDLRILFSA